MAISLQQLTIYLYSAHRAVIFAIAQLSCFRKAFDSVNHNLLLQKLYNKNAPHQLINWFFSYLQQRSQRVRVSTHHSRWLQLKGGMPQGSRLGPLCFLALVDDLNSDCLVHKYVDDTTLTEIVQRSAHSNIQDCFQQLLSWFEHNDMAVNFQKTKDIIMGPPSLVSNFFTNPEFYW